MRPVSIESNLVEISPKQIEALHDLCAENSATGGDRNVDVEQTYSKSGGTHLYVKFRKTNHYYHISARGRTTKLEEF